MGNYETMSIEINHKQKFSCLVLFRLEISQTNAPRLTVYLVQGWLQSPLNSAKAGAKLALLLGIGIFAFKVCPLGSSHVFDKVQYLL